MAESAVVIVERMLTHYDADPAAYGFRASVPIELLRELLALAKLAKRG